MKHAQRWGGRMGWHTIWMLLAVGIWFAAAEGAGSRTVSRADGEILYTASGALAEEARPAAQEGKPDAGQDKPEVERFDVKKGQVTARAPVTEAIREEARKLVQSLGGQAETFRADPKDGIVLRIPLKPSLEVRKPGFYAYATEVFLFLPEETAPYMLVFSEENDPRIFALTESAAPLLRSCGWKIK